MTIPSMHSIQLLIGGGEEEVGQQQPGSFESFREIAVREEGLLLPSQAGEVLGISKQGVQNLIERNKLTVWRFFDKPFVSAREVEQRKNSPRDKGGRPRKQEDLQAA